MRQKKSKEPVSIKRKATPEEVERYNQMLKQESGRLNLYRSLGVSHRVSLTGNYSTTATEQS